MNIYRLRKNYTSVIKNKDGVVKGKLAFKTKQTHWCHTDVPVVVPISVHSEFHEGVGGEMKMEAYVSIIQENVNGPVTILMAENAHTQVIGLKVLDAYQKCKREAELLQKRFGSLFDSCDVVYWREFVNESPSYPFYREKVVDMYRKDQTFRELVKSDAIDSYTTQRRREYPDKELYLQKAQEDILEQCICVWILIDKGFGFYFYPGEQYRSVMYVNHANRLSFIHVFVSIEKKSHVCLHEDASIS